jgi:GT2 family glycosyltransferase
LAKRHTTIIIPNYNGAHRLSALLASIARQTRPPGAVILVDNGSTDNSRGVFQEEARQHGLQAEVLNLDRNYGFAVAVNRGIQEARTEFVAIVNNDVQLDARWLELLEDALMDDPAPQFACPLLFSRHDPSRIDGAFDLLTRSGCAARALHGESSRHPVALVARPVQFPPMTAALFRRSLFDLVGLLDEAYGSYLEDVDFGLRAAAAGFKGIYVPSATGLHEGSATLGQGSPRVTELISRNQLLLVARNYPPSLRRSWWWPILIGNLLFVFMAVKKRRGLAAIRGKLAGFPALWSSQAASGQSDATIARLRAAVAESEGHLHTLVQSEPDRTAPGQRFWTAYFRLCRPASSPHPPTNENTEQAS